jgi:hypothetical protein
MGRYAPIPLSPRHHFDYIRWMLVCLLLVPVLLLTLPVSARAGAWLRPPGEALISTRYVYYQADDYYNLDGTRTTQPSFYKNELNIFGEYGATEDWTLGMNLFLNVVTQSGGENTGLADPEFFARTEIYSSQSSKLALQPLLKLPSWYAKDATPASGSESTDAELMLLYGRNLAAFSPRDYLDIGAGYRIRGTRLNNQYRAYAAYGLHFGEKMSLVPALYYTQATRMPDDQVFQQNGDQDYDLAKFDITVFYALDARRSLYLAYANEFYGINTGAGQSVSIGLVGRFDAIAW